MIWIDAAGLIVDMNPAAVDLCGYSTGEVAGLRLERLVTHVVGQEWPQVKLKNLQQREETTVSKETLVNLLKS